jgi:hypothetical protein
MQAGVAQSHILICFSLKANYVTFMSKVKAAFKPRNYGLTFTAPSSYWYGIPPISPKSKLTTRPGIFNTSISPA